MKLEGCESVDVSGRAEGEVGESLVGAIARGSWHEGVRSERFSGKFVLPAFPVRASRSGVWGYVQRQLHLGNDTCISDPLEGVPWCGVSLPSLGPLGDPASFSFRTRASIR